MKNILNHLIEKKELDLYIQDIYLGKYTYNETKKIFRGEIGYIELKDLAEMLNDKNVKIV